MIQVDEEAFRLAFYRNGKATSFSRNSYHVIVKYEEARKKIADSKAKDGTDRA